MKTKAKKLLFYVLISILYLAVAYAAYMYDNGLSIHTEIIKNIAL